ncbi:MAG: hypothetical protein CJD30_03525 [Sulfuricurvum sp. PD_MW2]|uniref:hypothetical protein n=1 Tax=Sulfuricurvum sp. PD_MW2 TaxID=2027917 RepID=UPI000C062F12|nr:hypothetical protein [Sulfuricurvum sp. PD_MW2]PHM18043.1 MAG: hypothetical protein CJD30_03525 [Sulfuricurvum sp. PD_MW2]
MSNELKIKISTTADVKAVQEAISSIDGIEKVSKTASKEIDNTSSSLDRMASSVKTLIASFIGYSAISSVVKSGIELTGQFEQMKIGIASLISVNSQNITSMGKHIDASQKFAMAQKASAEAVQLLRKSNLETPATLEQLTAGFQAALGPSMKLGFSVQETVKYSTLMTQAAAAMRVPMDQLSQEMASVLSGNIDMNSVVAKNIGLTNEQIKTHIKQGDVYDFLIGKLSDFGAAGKEMENSWSGLTSSLEDSWNQFKMSTVHDSGIFDLAKSGTIELTKLLQNQNGELDNLSHYTKEAVIISGSFYGVTLLGTGIKALKEIDIATKIATVSQISFNTAVAVNPWVIIGASIAAVIGGLYEYKSLTNEIASNNAKTAGSKLFMSDLNTFSGKDTAQQLHDVSLRSKEVYAEEKSIIAELKKRSGFAYQSSKNDDIVDNLRKRKDALHAEQLQLVSYYEKLKNINAPVVDELITNPYQKTDAEKKAEEEAAKKAAIAAENLKQAYLSINKDIAGFTGNEHDKAIASINDQAEKYRKAKVDEVKIAELTSSAMTALYQKEQTEKNKLLIDHYSTIGEEDTAYYIKQMLQVDEMVKQGILSTDEINQYKIDQDRKYFEQKAQVQFQADEQAKEAIKTYNAGLLTANTEYYTAIGDTSSAYYLQEEAKMKRLAETGWYTNAQMLAIKAKDNDTFQKEQWKRDNQFLSGLFDNMNKAMDEQFFNAMNGKFVSFGNWLKDFWSSITQSMTRSLSKSLADSILGTGENSTGGIINLFKSYGGLGSVFGAAVTPAALIGATKDDAGFTTTKGGTVYDANGQVTKQGNDYADVMNAISIASSANTIYGALTGGISSSIAAGFGQAGASLASGMQYVGFSSDAAASAAMGVGDFGMGLSSPWASAGASGAEGAGAMLGGAALGAAGGYVLGSVGDKLLGADTKAGTYGAIGGAAGALIAGPVGAVIGAALGSLVGGMFGSTKVKGSGYYFGSSTEDGSNAQTYVDYKKKSWFSSSSWTTYSPLSDVEKSKIKGLFDTYDYLLVQLGTSKEITLAAGRYAGATFQDQLAKNFITAFTDVQQSSSTFSTIYSYWTDYAKSINQTISQAFATSVGTYVSSTRSFNEWKLGSGTIEQLKFTADYLTKDLAALENQMGVSGITVENYLSKYEEAMKSSFTPETITTWKSLGEAIMAATNANTKYTDSIKALTTYTKPSDMMLSRVGDATSITGRNDGTVLKPMLDTLQRIFRELQNQTTQAQIAAGRV